MQTLVWIVTVLIAVGAVILICLLLNMVRTGDYSALIGDGPHARQSGASVQPESVSMLTSAKTSVTDLADVLLLRREPEVAYFSEDPLEITDEAQRKKILEDLVKIRKSAD